MKELIRVWRAITSILQQSKLIPFKGKDLQEIENKLKFYYQSPISDSYYDDLASYEGEDKLSHWNDMKRRHKFIELCEQAKSILDFGCGAGNLALALSNHFPSKYIFANDIGKNAGCFLKEAIPKNFTLKKTSVLNSQFDTASFDLVISKYVIEHVVYPDKMIKEAHRILKPNGYLYLVYPHLIFRTDVGTLLKELASWATFSRKLTYLDPQVHSDKPLLEYDDDAAWLSNHVKIKRMMKDCGFEIVANKLTQSLIIAKKQA
jgi:ubiquinone/menaquinone biosynthesis C-methylase UbiE